MDRLSNRTELADNAVSDDALREALVTLDSLSSSCWSDELAALARVRALVLGVALAPDALATLPSRVDALRQILRDRGNGDLASLIHDVRDSLDRALSSRDVGYPSLVTSALHTLQSRLLRGVPTNECELGAELGIHAAYVGRLLRRSTGLGFREWRQLLRVLLGARELVDRTEQVAQVAYCLGYDHASQFDRDFKRILGLNPTTFRKRSRQLLAGDPYNQC
jgi:AraC-like DNA-binding protein